MYMALNAYPVDSGESIGGTLPLYGAAGLSKDHARVSRSIVLTRGLPGLLGTVSLA